MKHGMLIAGLATTLNIASLPVAQADNLSLSSGFDYSTGNYGTAINTSILSIPVTAKYETELWTFKLTVPYLQITGSSAVVPSMGRIRPRGARSSVQSGLGDMVAMASYNWYQTPTLGVDLTGKIKFATADANLGSGENDYAAQIDAYRSIDNFTAMGALGVKALGTPAATPLNMVLYGSIGGGYQFTRQVSGGLDLSLAQSPSTTTSGQQELTAYASFRIDQHLKAQVYMLRGYSSGSPDSGIGALISSQF